jgi:hypothetical protein
MSAAESKADAQELEKKENGQKDLKATDAQKEEAGKNDSGVEAKPSPARPQ